MSNLEDFKALYKVPLSDLIDPLATETTLAVNGVDPDGDAAPDEIGVGEDVWLCRKGSGWDLLVGGGYVAFYDDCEAAFTAAIAEVDR